MALIVITICLRRFVPKIPPALPVVLIALAVIGAAAAIVILLVGFLNGRLRNLPRLLDQLNPLLRLVRQQQELQAAAKNEGDGSGDGKLPRIPR